MEITFPDGNTKHFEAGVTPEDIAGALAPALKKKTVAAYVNGELYDLNRPIEEDASINLITKDNEEALEILRHSTAHLLAQAVKRLYPDATFGVGPAIKDGFYYDIATAHTITEEDLPKIEDEMRRIVKEQEPMDREVVSKEEALKRFKDDPYKVEMIKEMDDDEVITIYSQGEFKDLCRGGHVGNTKHIKHFKLLSVAGAYWRGDSDNAMLQRIYGTAWFTKDDLQHYLEVLKERKERDHRKLGKELEIFMLDKKAGQGLPIWLPNGYAIRKTLEDYVYNLERKHGYRHIQTPVLGTKALYETSGHWEHYRDAMFPPMEYEDETYVLRPMSCPHHMIVYNRKLRSYRDLPLRYAEIVTQHRHEASGALTGLERVRAMTLTDSHIFARRDQIKDEVLAAYRLIQQAINDLGIEIDYVELALRDKEKGKFHDDDVLWDEAEALMKELLDEAEIEYTVMEGEAAFYGPKIDIQVRTAMDRVITMSTVQLDFLLPERFDLTYIGKDGEKHRPVVIHRGLISTWERLVSILLEHYKGAFPTWLAPKQVRLIPVNLEAHGRFAESLNNRLIDEGMRSDTDFREEKLGYKIREAQTEKIPYSLVLGDNEVENDSVTYRKYGAKDQTTLPVEDFIEMLKKEVRERRK
ncbi:MAG: threonine--tRNA ligase [Candidatus Izemoplasmataceae bacterium]